MKIILSKQNYDLLSESELEAIGDSVLKAQDQPTSVSVGVFYVNSNEIQKINSDYRGKDKPTDVITFRLIENPGNLPLSKTNFPFDYDEALGGIYIGEIFICTEVAARQASEFNHSTRREVAELFVHGMLHILGYDHENEDDRAKMKVCELEQMPFLDNLIKE